MSCFAPEQLRECTTVHDRSSTEARHEIARNAPPPVLFLYNKKARWSFPAGLVFSGMSVVYLLDVT
ncbi:MAG: hypothetical protein IJW08_11660 [Lentisphaeria bacterium]|nr:hypothetical protein [Lentisphaeria bacterium]MBQ7397180.1 hypothetical protein [Lentisphaeria bacterium]